jgi:hypothetical protein
MDLPFRSTSAEGSNAQNEVVTASVGDANSCTTVEVSSARLG